MYRHSPQQALKFHELASELCVGVQRIFLPQKKQKQKKKLIPNHLAIIFWGSNGFQSM